MATVAVVIGIFFVAGLIVGGVAVIALPALRHQWFGRPSRRDRAGGQVPPPHDRGSQDAARWEDEDVDDDRPRWPGDAAADDRLPRPREAAEDDRPRWPGDAAGDDRPRWPGDADGGYSGR